MRGLCHRQVADTQARVVPVPFEYISAARGYTAVVEQGRFAYLCGAELQ